MTRTHACAAAALFTCVAVAGPWTAHVVQAKSDAGNSVDQLRHELEALEEQVALEPWLVAQLATISSNADAYAALGAPCPVETLDEERLMEEIQLELERAQFQFPWRCRWGCADAGTVARHPALHSRWLTLCSFGATYDQVVAFFLGIERRPDRWIDAFSLTFQPLPWAAIQEDGSPMVALNVCVRVATLRSGRAPARPSPSWRSSLRKPDPGAGARCDPRGR